MNMDRQCIFVTGAGSGIGEATAKLFASKGWFVGLFDLDADRLGRVAAALPADKHMSGHLDVRRDADWTNAVDRFASTTGGRMDVLLNNAGIARSGPFDQIAPDQHRDIIETNLIGVINGTRATLPLLKPSAPARVINSASAAGLFGPPNLAVYGAAKAGVINLSQALDLEFAPDNVQVSCVLPWFIDTPILEIVPVGSNESARETLRAVKEAVYPVERAAEAIWSAAHSNKRQITVGRESGLIEWLRGYYPGQTRKILQRRYAQQREWIHGK